jgi:hypothetical protein
MAGSYKHCITPEGKFRSEDFTDMIENLSDAYEACEEMVFMIDFLADGDSCRIENALEAFYASKQKEIEMKNDSEFGTIIGDVHGGQIILTETGQKVYLSMAFNPLTAQQLKEIKEQMDA